MAAKIKVLTLMHPKAGLQLAIVDERDIGLVVEARLVTERGIRWLVANPEGAGVVRLARLIAERWVRRPSPDHVYVGYRNDSPCDMRASNLYWYSRAETRRGKKTATRKAARPQPAKVSATAS